MTRKSHLTPVPSLPDEEAWTADTELLPGLVSNIGKMANNAQTQLELVTPAHVPQAGAQRESSYVPPKAVTPDQKATRDMAEAHKKQGIVPFGHDPITPRIVK